MNQANNRNLILRCRKKAIYAGIMVCVLLLCDQELFLELWFRVARQASVKYKNETKVALMIGFPLSGQNLLQTLVEDGTNTSTATIYGGFVMDSVRTLQEEVDSIPLYDLQQAPFAFSDTKPFPRGSLVLTRSYCGDQRQNLFPEEYVKRNLKDWLDGCYAGQRFLMAEGRNTPVRLNKKNVKKYLHLVRNPMSNIAARFEEEHESWKGDQADLKIQYPLNRDGFKKWCNRFDDNVVDVNGIQRRTIAKKHYLTSERLVELSWKIPCHTDFFRLVHWHNWAFEAEKAFYKSGKPVKLVRFEKLLSHGVKSDEILKYLGFEKYLINETSERIDSLRYKGAYFTEQEVEYITEYVRLSSTLLTWRVLSKYFN